MTQMAAFEIVGGIRNHLNAGNGGSTSTRIQGPPHYLVQELVSASVESFWTTTLSLRKEILVSAQLGMAGLGKDGCGHDGTSIKKNGTSIVGR
jgi:hypothetical protein